MFKKMSLLMIVALLSLSGSSLSIAQVNDAMTAAMVVANVDLAAGFDQAQHDRLVTMGYDVTVVPVGDVGTAFTIDDANDFDLLLVSETISSSGADPLIGTTTPTMHNESYGWDNWFLTTKTKSQWATGINVEIVNDTHPIAVAAGLAIGPMAFYTGPTDGDWTTELVSALAPGAVNIAQVVIDTTDTASVIFAVNKGAMLANGSPSPNRISGFSIPGTGTNRADMTADAWALWDATINWLTAKTAAMVVNPGNLSAGFDQAQHDRLVAMGYDVTVVPQSDVGTVFTIDDANAVDLLLVSETISSAGADPLIGTITPTMHNESYGWDNWLATTKTKSAWLNVGDMDIVDADHEIPTNAGVGAGPVSFFNPPTGATTELASALAPGAKLIGQAVDAAGDTCALIFTIDKGWGLVDGSAAPARFAGFSIPGDKAYAADAMTDDAWALWDATIEWLSKTPELIPDNMVTWDFENGNDEGFTLGSLIPATPAADDPSTAGDEALTGGFEVGNLTNLPEAGVAWTVGSPKMFNGQLPGADPAHARIDANGVLDYSLGKARIGVESTGSLNTYLLNMHGDFVHNADNDQIATSPPIVLGGNMWLSAASWGGGGALAPEFDADPTKGYVDGSSGIAVLSAVDRLLLASMYMGNKGTFGVDSLDLSAFAGQQVVIQVVDAFEGGWGWLAVDKIQISTEVIKLPTLGLVAQWKLDETSGTAVADELGNSDGTLVGGADSMWVAGWDGNALAFSDSAHVLVEANDVIEMDSTESFTLSMLVKADPITNTGGTHLIHKGDFGKWYAMECKDGQVRIAVDDAVTKTQLGVDITSIWPTNRWAHLVGVRDIGANVLRLYLNGELIGEMEDGTEGDIASPDLPLSIGNYWGSTSNALMEQLDDVRIYNYAFNEGAVEELFESYGIQKDVMIAHWKLDETSGTAVADELGNSDGTLVSGSDAMWVAGWDGNALAFSDSAHVLVDANDVIEMDSTESFTISMLVKADPITNTGGTHLIHKGDFGKWYAMECKDGQVRIAVDDAVTKTQLGVDITSIWPANEWAHLVGVRDRGADVLRLYLNGQLIGSIEDGTEGDIASPDLPLSIGNYWGSTSNALMEQLDDVRIYNYALTDGAVEDLFDGYGIATDVEEERGTMPLTYDLKQNYPNPFNPTTSIQFQIPKAGHVTISVYNSIGQKVETLVDENMKSGMHHVTFDAAKYSSGIYFYRIKAEGFSQVKKMMLIK